MEATLVLAGVIVILSLGGPTLLLRAKRLAQTRLPGTVYNNTEKFRIEVLFYLGLLLIAVMLVFLAVIASATLINSTLVVQN